MPSQRVQSLLQRLSVREKIDLLAGADAWHTAAIPRLGIGAMEFTDGPNGVCAWSRWDANGQQKATALPVGICLGATFDTDLAREYGRVLGEETLAYGYDVILGPCMNIVRTPLNGRNFETLGEDPQLNGRLATAYVQGVQVTGCGTSVKHYCCNNQEHERMRGDSVMDGRTLREIYLPHFEMVVREAQPWTVMSSYNRLNGTYVSENPLVLKTILRAEWGFTGFVISDWGAVHSTVEGVTGGTDLEMPGPAKYRGDLLMAAATNWQIEQAAIDECAGYVLDVVERSGKLDGKPLPPGSKDTPEHHAVAGRVAEEGMVLLKNDQAVLPLDAKKLKRLAVIGRNATDFRYGGGGSSSALPTRLVQPLEALKEALPGVEIIHIPGPLNRDQPTQLDVALGSPVLAGDGKAGFLVEAFDGDNCDGTPTATARIEKIDIRGRGNNRPFGLTNGRRFCVRFTTTYTAGRTGMHRFMLRNSGTARLLLDGKTLINHRSSIEHYNASMEALEFTLPAEQAEASLLLGQKVTLVIEFVKPANEDIGWLRAYAAAVEDLQGTDDIAAAAKIAAACDAALIIAGMPVGYETEAKDRPHMRLPGAQDRLIAAVAKAQAKTAVILNVGSPIEMPWVEQVPAVLMTWFPGQEGAKGIARLILGEANPCGHLPISLPKRYEDNPTFGLYPGSKHAVYGEGIFVGYRWYDTRSIAPLFPFGHGLSYTTFSLSAPRVPASATLGKTVKVACAITNTGNRAGRVAVQLYINDAVCPHRRPPQELKGFSKVFLKPGESQVVEFTLDTRAFSYIDPDTLTWRADPGRFNIRFGLSSRDIRLEAPIDLNAG